TKEVDGDGMTPPNDCTNCSLCQYPCHLQPPPPPPPSGYPSYQPPPPPEYPPSPPAEGNCPPVPVQCCQYAPPMPYTYYPDGNYSGSSPLPFLIKPTCTLWSSVIFALLLCGFLFHV
ncbi:unnamed protein product, partial [Ilex paraguariensis]